MGKTRILTIALMLATACAGADSPPPESASIGSTAQQARPEAQAVTRPPAPPGVLMGAGRLECSMSATANGIQKLELREGNGIEFTAVVTPMLDGTATLLGPEKGGNYRFTSHLAQHVAGVLSGVGKVTITSLDTKVSVDIDAYKQPGGPGEVLNFTSDDMAKKGTYVEFVGVAVDGRGDRHSFRVTFGAATTGKGSVRPATDNHRTEIMAKMVTMEAPITTVVQVFTEVKALP